MPSETSVPIPAASTPGRSTTGSRAPPIAAASIRITAAISGEANTNESAARLPGAGDQRQHRRFDLSSSQADRQHRQTRTDRQQRPLGAEHDPEAEPGEAGEDHAGQIASGS